MLAKKRFDPATSRVHVVSLSCNEVPPVRYGGIELIVANLCEGISELGIRTVCYSPGHLSVANTLHYQTLPEPTPGPKDGGIPNSPEHLRRVRQGLRELAKPGDVVLFNHPDHYRFLRRRVPVTARATWHFAEVAHWIDVGLPRNIIYPSQALSEELGRPGTVIPHGERLLFDQPPSDARDDFLFFAGRVTKDKGVDIALAACRILQTRLVIAGPLNEKGFAASVLADPLVTYLGELRYPELLRYYASARGFVYLTQYSEPFGLSVIEAMAAGCPVITTGRGGTGETVLNGETGFFCETPEDVVKAYARLSSISSARCTARARQYSIERMAKRYVAFFQALR